MLHSDLPTWKNARIPQLTLFWKPVRYIRAESRRATINKLPMVSWIAAEWDLSVSHNYLEQQVQRTLD